MPAPDRPEHPRSPHWHAVRAAHLEKHPTCAACGGTDHLEVHHVQPYHLHPAEELDPKNLITLCESPAHACHLVFGHLYSWHSFNATVRRNAAAWLAKVRNRPHG